MRSSITALSLVLPEGIDESSDDAIVEMMEKKLLEPPASPKHVFDEFKELAKKLKMPLMTTVQGLGRDSLLEYSALDAELSSKMFSLLDTPDTMSVRTLKQRGVRPIMMIHDEMYFDIEMTQDEMKKKMGRPPK